ncbi:unnamed protein product [Ilex paraguariensis]|uniref:Uncharacterized protein n=1 Tax=Ilex paraguariensis TaxID=185542 RepID=A0ABC8RAP8_9AQUA
MEQIQETYKEDTVRVMEARDHSGKDNISLPQADPRSPAAPAEEILVANKEGLDITEKKIRDTRKESLGNILEDIRETSKETTEIAFMAITNDHEYVRVGNSGTSLDGDRGLYCAKEPPDKGFHFDDEVTTNLACVEIDSIEINLQVEDYNHSGIVTRSKSRKQSLPQISYD